MSTYDPPSSAVLYDIRPTAYGGRGVFSRHFIPKGTSILSCTGPYASVILRKFKKEVCAWCFSYAFESGRGKWFIKPLSPDGPLQGKGGNLEAGVWFCAESCRHEWLEKYQVGKGEGGLWFLDVLSMLEKHASGVEGPVRGNGSNAIPVDVFDFLDSEDIKPERITVEFVDSVWSLAEGFSVDNKKPSKSASKVALNEFELDTARFILDGLASKVVEDVYLSEQYFLDLQNNELAYIRQNPYILASHVRIYRFLRELVSLYFSSLVLKKSHQPPICFRTDINRLVSLGSNATKVLMDHLSTSSFVRALLGRDPGNVFGIWEITPDDQDSEMFGWGAYVFGSYFNHDCDPNIKKRRLGRSVEFYSLRDIPPGVELCISYIDGRTAEERNAQLQQWFFQCRCRRCSTELEEIPLED